MIIATTTQLEFFFQVNLFIAQPQNKYLKHNMYESWKYWFIYIRWNLLQECESMWINIERLRQHNGWCLKKEGLFVSMFALFSPCSTSNSNSNFNHFLCFPSIFALFNTMSIHPICPHMIALLACACAYMLIHFFLPQGPSSRWRSSTRTGIHPKSSSPSNRSSGKFSSRAPAMFAMPSPTLNSSPSLPPTKYIGSFQSFFFCLSHFLLWTGGLQTHQLHTNDLEFYFRPHASPCTMFVLVEWWLQLHIWIFVQYIHCSTTLLWWGDNWKISIFDFI